MQKRIQHKTQSSKALTQFKMIQKGLKIERGGSYVTREVLLNPNLSQGHLFDYKAPSFGFHIYRQSKTSTRTCSSNPSTSITLENKNSDQCVGFLIADAISWISLIRSLFIEVLLVPFVVHWDLQVDDVAGILVISGTEFVSPSSFLACYARADSRLSKLLSSFSDLLPKFKNKYVS